MQFFYLLGKCESEKDDNIMKQLLLLVFSISLFLSCNKKNNTAKEETDYRLFLKKIETIQIKIDSSISPFIYNSQYLWDENQLIFNNHNLNDNALVILDLDKKNISKLSFANEGVDELKNAVFNFYFRNRDSIFFFPMYAHKVFLFDRNLKIEKKIEFKTGIDNIGQSIVYMGSRNAHFSDKKIIFTTFPTNANRISESLKDPLFFEFSFTDSVARPLPFTYNLNYTSDSPLQHPLYIEPRSVFDLDGNIIFTFPKSNKLFKTNGKVILKTADIENSYFSDYQRLKNLNDFGIHAVTGNANTKLDFDKKKEHIYLFIEMGLSKINPITGLKNEVEDKPILVLVYDKNFKKISEQKFDGSFYDINSSFVGRKGLYLSLNNKKNKNFDEDLLQFEIFKLSEK